MADDRKTTLDDWQQYPVFAELLSDRDRFVELREKCLQTCAGLDRLLREGTPEDREVAQRSLNAFGRALELLDHAVRARDEMIGERDS